MGDRACRLDQPPVGEVPPQIRVERRDRRHAEDSREQERAEYHRAGDTAKQGGGAHGQESNGPVTDFLRSKRPGAAPPAPEPQSVAKPAFAAIATAGGRAGEAIPARVRASTVAPGGRG